MNEPRYHLTVTVEEPNENYSAEMIEANRRPYNPYDNPGPMPQLPQRYLNANVLDVRLTPAEFEAIKRAVLETFK